MNGQTPLASHQTASIDNRIRGAVWGQFTGDAFCLGSHWIYDLDELRQRFPSGLRGFDLPLEGHYHYGKQPGHLTHYGDAALLLLQSLAENGAFDAVDFGSRFVARMESIDYHGYRDHAAKGTVANALSFCAAHPGEAYSFQDGADDDQPATVTRLAPLAALYYKDDNYLAIVERVTRVCQNNNRAVAYAQAHALIMRELFSGNALQESFAAVATAMASKGVEGNEVADKIRQAIAAQDQDVTTATLAFGQSCPLASSFPSAIHCCLRHSGNIGEAIKATAEAGGDNAGRAAMIGAWLGSYYGIAAVPVEWRNRLTAQGVITDAVERIIALSRQHR